MISQSCYIISYPNICILTTSNFQTVKVAIWIDRSLNPIEPTELIRSSQHKQSRSPEYTSGKRIFPNTQVTQVGNILELMMWGHAYDIGQASYVKVNVSTMVCFVWNCRLIIESWFSNIFSNEWQSTKVNPETIAFIFFSIVMQQKQASFFYRGYVI